VGTELAESQQDDTPWSRDAKMSGETSAEDRIALQPPTQHTMPFAISHTAAVLPLGRQLRRMKLLSAAVIGSMVPDFSVFLPLRMSRYETHSLEALFTFCLPIGLICYWAFQLHIKPATLQLMPDRLYDLWRDEGESAPVASWRQWLLAAIGIVFGALTHLVWDGFTHTGGRGVALLSMFDDVRIELFDMNMSWYRAAQHVSSVIGLLFVMFFFWRTIAAAAVHDFTQPRLFDKRQRHLWFYLYAGVAALSAAILAPAMVARAHRIGTLGIVAEGLAVASMWGIVISLVLVSVPIRSKLKRYRARA
jgi:hypothetical protein